MGTYSIQLVAFHYPLRYPADAIHKKRHHYSKTFVLLFIYVESNHMKRQVSVMWLYLNIDSRPFSGRKCFTMSIYTYPTKEVPQQRGLSWRRHQMETFSALLANCAGNSPVTCEFPTQRPVTRSFDIYFDKRLSKQPWGWWFETPSRSLWLHRNVCLSCCIRCTAHCDAGLLLCILYLYVKP